MKTRIITAVVGLIVLAGVLFTFDTLVFNLVIAAITLIALHEIYSALGFEKRDWPLLAVLVSYTLLIMLSSYSVCRAMVMPASFLVVLFYAIYLVVRNGVISYQKASGLAMFSGIVIFCFYSFIRLKEMLPVEEYATTPSSSSCSSSASPGAAIPAPTSRAAPLASISSAGGQPQKDGGGCYWRRAGHDGVRCAGHGHLLHRSRPDGRVHPLQHWRIHVCYHALLACVAAVLGIYGDLFASVIKRQCGIKDYGTIFPGHGGILDRFDSVMFIAPFVTMVVIAAFYN